MIRLNFSQIMDSQIDSNLLDNILENDIISLISGESDTDLLGPDLDLNLHEDMDTTKLYSILDELMASPPTHNTKQQYSTNTTTSTTSSTILHPLSAMTTTITHSTINTTNPLMQQTTATHNTTLHQLIHQSPRKQKNPPLHTSSKHCNTKLLLLQYPPPQHHHYAHPIMHLLYQLTQTHHPQPRQNPKIHAPIHNPDTCNSPSTSSPIAPNFPWLPHPVPIYNDIHKHHQPNH